MLNSVNDNNVGTDRISERNLKISVLSKSDTSDLVDRMKPKWPTDSVPKIKTFKVYEIDDERRLLVSEDITAVQVKEEIVPFLGKPELLGKFPSVKVDTGAIKFVCNGAKVLRPGIIEFESFKKSAIVTVKDPTHGKIIAVGVALEESDVAKAMQKGYVVDNLHYITDKVWQTYKELIL